MEDINKNTKFDPLKYVSEYTKEHYDRIMITAPKGTKQNVMKLTNKPYIVIHFATHGYFNFDNAIKTGE